MTQSAPRTGAAPAPRRLGRVERRSSIVAAAARAFVAGGYSSTSMADISDAAGVSHLIVYRHFSSKDELYETVLQRARDNLSAALSAPTGRGRFGPTVEALLGAAREDEEAFRVLWRHAAREPEFSDHADAARRELLAVARDALAPMVAPEHVGWAARATLSYAVEAVLVWIEDGDERLDARFLAATEAALRAGVRSWSKGGGGARTGADNNRPQGATLNGGSS